MANVILQPQSGTLQDSKSLSFTLSDISITDFRLRVENATNKREAELKSFVQSGNSCSGVVDISIPATSSNSVYSLFFIIEAPTEDGWKVKEIIPSIFYLSNEVSKFDGVVHVTPSFIGPSDICSIRVKAIPNKKTVFSVNDRRFAVHTNPDGLGSVHFKGTDVLEAKPQIAPERFPVFYYDEEDNYTTKKFSGTYVTTLPSMIATHAIVDPRCDPNSDTYISDPAAWSPPPECEYQGPGPNVGPVGPTVPPTCLPTSCNEGQFTPSYMCRVHNDSTALLNNGMIAHAHVGVYSGTLDPNNAYYNKTTVEVHINDSSLDANLITTRNVAIAPKEEGEDFQIYVSEDLFNLMAGVDDTSASDVYVMFYNKTLGYQCLRVTGRAIDEYTGAFILLAVPETSDVQIEGWLFCVSAVFFHFGEAPSLNISKYTGNSAYWFVGEGEIDKDGNKLPIEEPLQTLNVSVAANPEYVGDTEGTPIYLVAEAITGGQSQLFFSSFWAGDLTNYSDDDSGRFLWVQLTNDGNNRNPKAYVDKTNTLHVFWESDRSGVNQIYYGVLGPTTEFSATASLASAIDKHSELNDKEDKPFEYTSDQLLVAPDTSENVPVVTSAQLVPDGWVIQSDVTLQMHYTPASNHLGTLSSIISNTLDEDGMAFAQIQIQTDSDNPSDTTESPYDQFNYQVSFDFSATVVQQSYLTDEWDGTAYTAKDVDNLYDTWKTEFTSQVSSEATNYPIYVKYGNKFTLGRLDNVYDRVLPIMGSFDGSHSSNPSWNDFQIDITKANCNLKDYSIGLMFEKSIFKATNIESLDNFAGGDNPSVGYVEEETHTIFTGRAKLVAFIKTEDENDDYANYIIIREVSEPFDVATTRNFTFIVSYTKVDSIEVVNSIDAYDGAYVSRYAGMLICLMDSETKFSHAFVSELSDDYNNLNIGFGIPYGGYYIADKMYPSKMTVFEEMGINIDFTNIEISSPTYVFNNDLVYVPDSMKDLTQLRVLPTTYFTNPSSYISYTEDDLLSLNYQGVDVIQHSLTLSFSSIQNYYEIWNVTNIDKLKLFFVGSQQTHFYLTDQYLTYLFDTGELTEETNSLSTPISIEIDVSSYDYVLAFVDVIPPDFYGIGATLYAYFIDSKSGNNFPNIPLTFEGVNQSINIDAGICNDVHAVWESNRSKYWDIYTTNGTNKLRPYRFDTQITDTESNSIVPDISVNRNGQRLITWHDDRDGPFAVYAARSLAGYSCDEPYCESKMAQAFSPYISQCQLSDRFTATADGAFHFRFDLYSDNGKENLYKSISSATSVDGWYVDGVAMTVAGASLSTGDEVTVFYSPNNQDDIFDRVLYADLVGIVS